MIFFLSFLIVFAVKSRERTITAVVDDWNGDRGGVETRALFVVLWNQQGVEMLQTMPTKNGVGFSGVCCCTDVCDRLFSWPLDAVLPGNKGGHTTMIDTSSLIRCNA